MLACGETMFLGTAMIAMASALPSGVCGTCMFISSYGFVFERRRKRRKRRKR